VRLDESAMREARKWRMKPGLQDGVATAMWKRVPVTFQLKN
jgi:TonB family protein